MKLQKLVVAAGFSVVATGAIADSSVNLTQIDNVNDIDGRASVVADQLAGPVVTRPANEVAIGRRIEEGPVPVAIKADDIEVNLVSGRS